MDEADDALLGRSTLLLLLPTAVLLVDDSRAVIGLRGTGDDGTRAAGREAAEGRVSGERGEEGTGLSEGDSVGDLPSPLPARDPTLLTPTAPAAVAEDERARETTPEVEEPDRGEGEAGERGDMRVESVDTTGRCNRVDCTVSGGLPIRLASVVGFDGATRGGDECDEVSSCLRSSLGELG